MSSSTTKRSTPAKSPSNSTAKRKPSTSGKNTKVTKRGPAKGSRVKTTQDKLSVWEDPIAKEIILILVGCIAIFLFLCNFGLIGPVGNAISSVMFGLFGVFTYILSFLVAGLIYFEASNFGNKHATIKIIACVVLFFALNVFAEVIGGATKGMTSYSITQIYKFSSAKHGGGVISGSISYFLCRYLSKVGCIFLTIAMSVICIVLISEKSLIYLFKSGGQKVYEKTKSGVDRSKQHSYERRQNAYERRMQQIEEEELAEQERILRMDRKADGVTIQTLHQQEEDELVAKIRDDIHEIMFNDDAPSKPKKKRAKKAAKYEDELEARLAKEYAELYPEEAVDQYPEEYTGSDYGFSRKDQGVSGTSYGYGGSEQGMSDSAYDYQGNEQGMSGSAYDYQGNEQGVSGSAYGYQGNEQGFSGSSYGYQGQEFQSSNKNASYDQGYGNDTYGQNNASNLYSVNEQMNGSGQEFGEPDYADGFSEEVVPQFSDDDVFGSKIYTQAHKVVNDMPAYEDHSYAHADSPYETGYVEKQTEQFDDTDPTEILNRTQHFTAKNESPTAMKVSKESAEQVASDTKKEIEEKQPIVPKKYLFPSINLLKRPDDRRNGDSQEKLQETARRLKQTLANFGVNVTITNISQGPTVTRYELQPEQGVKVSKIVGLTDDIKLNLAATDIRMEAPIPGKAAIGIEVPNQEAVSVAFYDLVHTREFREFPSKLCFAVGKDIGGKVIIADIAKMPHLLIAGATGSGKSVCINTIIMSILYKAHPDDVKLIMIDPKVVELSVYNGIPHLLVPVVTEAKKAAGALQWGVAEMTDRYQKFAEMNVRDLKGYNKKLEEMKKNGEENVPSKMPQIVIIVDELADLMMVAQNEVEEAICRLAQLARAAGIHLIIATQRPSVDVITGLIKANMPSRVAFAVSSGVDSRTILDQVGAEKLLGKGDMLFYPQGYTKPARLQGAFISDDEVSDVVDFLKNQVIGNVYSDEIQERIQTVKSAGSGAGSTDTESGFDELFEQAARRIFERNKASIGDLQRGLKVGFNRAARIMDQLCEAGVVGDDEGTKPRKILMSPEEFEEFVETYL